MLQGMTGYGSAERGDFRVEVRSLNHRYLEVNMRLPQGLVEQEMAMRARIKERFARGRFDVFVNMKPGRLRAGLNGPAARELYAALEGLRKELFFEEPVGMGDLLKLKELFISEEPGAGAQPLLDAFEEALGEVERMRVDEGSMIKDDVLARADVLEKVHVEMLGLLPAALSGMKERLVARLKALLSETGYDEARLLQEAAILAEKADISEELTRIKGHIGRMRKIISEGDKIGREFDFLLQELNREANTVCSKTDEMGLLNSAIGFKTEVERIRQQIQNLQ
jgi:uncharacterized protein (TIGR00255 family)